jgi:hypothetical protein
MRSWKHIFISFSVFHFFIIQFLNIIKKIKNWTSNLNYRTSKQQPAAPARNKRVKSGTNSSRPATWDGPLPVAIVASPKRQSLWNKAGPIVSLARTVRRLAGGGEWVLHVPNGKMHVSTGRVLIGHSTTKTSKSRVGLSSVRWGESARHRVLILEAGQG